MLKKWTAKTLMVCLIASATLVPAKSHAWVIGLAVAALAGAASISDSPSEFELVTCLILLPICVLDGGSAREGAANRTELAANGYLPDEIEQIVAGQAELRSRLGGRGLRLVRGGGDDQTSLATAVRSVYPTASPVYLSFLAEATGSAPR